MAEVSFRDEANVSTSLLMKPRRLLEIGIDVRTPSDLLIARVFFHASFTLKGGIQDKKYRETVGGVVYVAFLSRLIRSFGERMSRRNAPMKGEQLHAL